MNDPRHERLARVLIGFSVKLRRGERLLIDASCVPDDMVAALVREAARLGAIPFVQITSPAVQRELLRHGTAGQFEFARRIELQRMKGMQAYIALRGADNIFESSDVPTQRMDLATRILRPVMNWRIRHTRWCVLRWPTPGMAQQAMMSTAGFEEFFFRVCTLDYRRMAPGMAALKKLMGRTDRVEIKGPGTELRFSIKGIGSVACGGSHNIPDGEVFTAPVRDSVEGHITFNAPTVYQGTSFDNVRLVFRKGRITEATSSNTPRLNQILNADPGARHIGEFSLGFNPHILHPMRDILFDEKIAGSFHFTPGQAYREADNGNRSQVHWDLVCIQRKEYGGGEIRFDGRVIRKDGLFVPPQLKSLNPDRLLGKR
ncbi:MAG TPA: aminopeptidase [Verrucomicrobiae bacterium]|nr:aminopeptidase [Verrucomicrobiae bacterium]